MEYKITWNKIINMITYLIYKEVIEEKISEYISDYINNTITKQSNIDYKYLYFIGSPIIQMRFQFETLGLITTKQSGGYICWIFTPKGRAYISEINAIHRERQND